MTTRDQRIHCDECGNDLPRMVRHDGHNHCPGCFVGLQRQQGIVPPAWHEVDNRPMTDIEVVSAVVKDEANHGQIAIIYQGLHYRLHNTVDPQLGPGFSYTFCKQWVPQDHTVDVHDFDAPRHPPDLCAECAALPAV